MSKAGERLEELVGFLIVTAVVPVVKREIVQIVQFPVQKLGASSIARRRKARESRPMLTSFHGFPRFIGSPFDGHVFVCFCRSIPNMRSVQNSWLIVACKTLSVIAGKRLLLQGTL